MAVFKNSPPTITNGLTVYLDATNPLSFTSGSNTWRDLSGNDNHATLSGSVTFNNNNKSLFFSGSTMYATLKENPIKKASGNTGSYEYVNFSVEIWTNFTSSGNIFPDSIYGGAGLGNGGVNLAFLPTSPNCLIYSDGGRFLYGPTLPTNQNIHFVATIASVSGSQTIQNIYLNGRNVATRTDAAFEIGATIGSPRIFNSYSGSIYIYKTYSRALTANEVLLNYQAGLLRGL